MPGRDLQFCEKKRQKPLTIVLSQRADQTFMTNLWKTEKPLEMVLSPEAGRELPTHCVDSLQKYKEVQAW